MNSKQIIEEHILGMKKSMILLEELEAMFADVHIETKGFTAALLELEQDQVLEAVTSAGRTMKQPSLAYRYRINKHRIKQGFRNRLNRDSLEFHPEIQLDHYFSLSEQEYERDKLWINQISWFLKQQGLPLVPVPAPERSFQLTGNEKWISELGGETLLKRIGLWEKMLVDAVSDPLMMAINPGQLVNSGQRCCLHLIVENKTTFQALLPVLPETNFHTLIYGCGNKITGNFNMFDLQYPVKNCEHYFFYFGDIDFEGIRIWYEISKNRPIIPAIFFYEACLEMKYSIGKAYQVRHEEACKAFLAYFSQKQRDQLEHCLSEGGYYPQEALTTIKLQHIWRNEQWTTWNTWK